MGTVVGTRELAKLLRAIEIDGCDLITTAALKFSAMFFVRPAELRAQALAIFESLKPITGHGELYSPRLVANAP